MHFKDESNFKNENNLRANSPEYNNQPQYRHQHQHHHHQSTSTSSSTSSTDSGVIIIDNCTTIGNNKSHNTNHNNNNNNHKNNQQQYNNNKNNISHHNSNIKIKKNTHKSATINGLRVELPNEKIDNQTKAATAAAAKTTPMTTTTATATATDNEKFNIQQNNKINQNIIDEQRNNRAKQNINIENVIKITNCIDDDQHADVVIDVDGKNSNATVQQHANCCNHHEPHDDDDGFGDDDNGSAKSPTIMKNSPTPQPPSPPQLHSPNLSIRSTSISIVSIDENAIDSSIIDSDSDREADAEGIHTNYVVKKLGQQTTYPAGSTELPNINKGLTVISQQIQPNSLILPPEHILNGGTPSSPTAPQIGSIALTNSTDVTFGDKHFYEGPVTIQQILIDRRDKWKNDGTEHGGHDNPMFAKESDYAASVSKAYQQKSSDQPETPYSFICKRKAIILTVTVIVLTVLIGIIVLMTTRLPKSKQHYDNGEDSRKNIPINSTIGIEDEDEEYNTLLVMGRKDWMAREPKGEMDKLNLPVHRIIVSHTASETCMDQEQCSQRVRDIQSFHMDSNVWDDIGYNFLIGGDGYVYSARGWYNQGAHTKGYNTDSIGISFIGTFTTIKPTKKQIAAAELLIEEGIRLQTIAPNFCVYGARQLGATESPGLALYKIIQKWPHWSPNIDYKDNIGGGRILRIIARDGWLAQPPSAAPIPLDLPMRKVIVIATRTDICTTQAMCTYRVRYIQTFNIESLQNDDIIYNFLIGGDGNVYEGRGWDYRGAHLKGYNNETISLAYIGTFKQQNPNDKQMEVTKLLLAEGVRLNKLTPDYKIYAASKFDPTSTTSSADALYNSFKNWPHWSE